MNIRYKVGFFLLACIAMGILFISGIAGVLSFLVSLSIYGSLAYAVIWIYKEICEKEQTGFKKFFLKFLGSVGMSLSLLFVILGGYCYYQNEVSPAKMPLYTISNGQKTVLFQGMSHIGTENFYSQVRLNIQEVKEKGYVLYYEGVQPGTEENMQKFNQILGVEFDEELYKNFSKLYGLVHQDNDSFLGLVNDQDFNVDIGIDEVISVYEEKYPDYEIPDREVLEVSKEITATLAKLNDKQLQVLVYVNQAIINTIIKYDDLREGILNLSGNTDLFDVILNDRNTHLVNEIIESEHDDIIITYGLMHYVGVLEELQKQDSNWKLVDTSYLYPIK